MNNALSIVIADLPSVSLEAKAMLPTGAGVYFAIKNDGEVLYIGQTTNLKQRWQAHNLLVHLRGKGCTAIHYHLCNIQDLQNIEEIMIQQWVPLFNKREREAIERNAALVNTDKIVISVDRETLKFFRAECIWRDTTPTKELARLMAEQLQRWQHATPHTHD